MKPAFHLQITERALAGQVGSSALAAIVAANLGQDALRYQVGHDHFHFDNNALAAGWAYIEAQQQLACRALTDADQARAWQAFGRLSHCAQDFYAHTNYIPLWRTRHPTAPAREVEPLDPLVLASPELRSGRLYYPLEVLSFIPLLAPLVVPRLPSDSHAWMNKDHPGRPDFDYAFEAAVRRTRIEFDRLAAGLPEELARRLQAA